MVTISVRPGFLNWVGYSTCLLPPVNVKLRRISLLKFAFVCRLLGSWSVHRDATLYVVQLLRGQGGAALLLNSGKRIVGLGLGPFERHCIDVLVARHLI